MSTSEGCQFPFSTMQFQLANKKESDLFNFDANANPINIEYTLFNDFDQIQMRSKGYGGCRKTDMAVQFVKAGFRFLKDGEVVGSMASHNKSIPKHYVEKKDHADNAITQEFIDTQTEQIVGVRIGMSD